MILKVKLQGSGVPGDPFRVPLPTYSMIHGNVTQGYALVQVPDDIHGLTPDDLTGENLEQTTEGPHYPKLSDANLRKIHAHFDEHYAEHRGKFRVEQP